MKKILQHLEELKLLDNQRRGWLILSAFVATSVLGIICGWNVVQQSHLVWLVVTAGLTISVVWWYWTMRLIRQMIQFKQEESKILLEVIQEIKDITKEVSKVLTK